MGVNRIGITRIITAAILIALSGSASAQSNCEPCQTYVGGPYGWSLPSGYYDADGKHHPCAHYTENTCVKPEDTQWIKEHVKCEPSPSLLCYYIPQQ